MGISRQAFPTNARPRFARVPILGEAHILTACTATIYIVHTDTASLRAVLFVFDVKQARPTRTSLYHNKTAPRSARQRWERGDISLPRQVICPMTLLPTGALPSFKHCTSPEPNFSNPRLHSAVQDVKPSTAFSVNWPEEVDRLPMHP